VVDPVRLFFMDEAALHKDIEVLGGRVPRNAEVLIHELESSGHVNRGATLFA
jgi:hypothetical protein